MQLLPEQGLSWQQLHGHFFLAAPARGGAGPRRQVSARSPALAPEDLGDLPDEMPAGDLAGKEPQDDVLSLAGEAVLPVRISSDLPLGVVELL
ncbi:hypothetical protein ACFWEJ_25305 [Promicromonospora sp. NPDC060204]|uniref:hypothetical protein n=1 Tax=Promicromonospora sp. NPDC060204 TaxID=3347071 RepID=UPI00364CF918